MNLSMLGVAAFGLALVGTEIVRRFALRSGLLDVPNARSSHVKVTPRGGGVAILVALVLTAGGGAAMGAVAPRELLAWLGGGAIVAAVGFADDRRGVPPSRRLAAHALAAALPLLAFGVAPLPWFGTPLDLGVFGLLLGWVAVIWSVNLFNFMDGIDGIAASQAVFVLGAGALLSGATLPLVAAAAAAGFLVWNWSPARIFMGDVGSGFLGFIIAVAALQTMADGSLSVWAWLTLHALFVVDATVTLAVRAAGGKQLGLAHRSHAYQVLALRFDSHATVAAGFATLNLCWLLPAAAFAHERQDIAPLICAIAYAPLVGVAVWVGAGRS
jgi:Fuc2NAc and GlcNAc transferase